MTSDIILIIPIVFLSVVIHEIAHGFAALKNGDHTARLMGRLTLNPLVHIDIIGTILIPLVLIVTKAGFIFAWAKPVPINPNNFRNRKKGLIIVSLAGPLSNICFAFISALFFAIINKFTKDIYLSKILIYMVQINIVFFIFNLLPLPPLDGSQFLYVFLPIQLKRMYEKIRPFSFIILIVIINTHFFRVIFSFLVENIYFSIFKIVSLIL
ncbi:site-2 protease family protein [bacterium]